MRLIDRYIAEVGRHLPEKNRSDIEAEIRSALEDTMEEHSHETGESMDDKIIAEALQQLGDPKLLAYKYTQTKRYLIGPDWYDLYVEILKRILYTGLPIFMIVTLFITLVSSPQNIIAALLEVIGNTFNVGVQVWFWLTLPFVIVERVGVTPMEFSSKKPNAWTVDQLPELPKPRQISVGESVASLILVGISIVFVLWSPTIARIQSSNEFVPLLNPELWRLWLPIFFVIAGLSLILELFKLKVGNWTPALTTANVILCLISITYTTALVMTQEVVNPAFLAALNGGVAEAELHDAATWTVNISAAITIGTFVWSIFNSIRMAQRFKQVH